ncbi:MAG TPA: TolC family protein [Steroidobacteraceae bacterium]
MSALLAGCATYAPLPLPAADDLTTSARTAAPDKPALGMDAVATLAVLNNPELRAARATLHVAQAQAFAAGLLPDPQLSYSADYAMDHVVSHADPRYPEFNAYGLGLAIDLQTLLTHGSMHATADASYRQARQSLLWEEWQTVAQARTLYVQRSVAADRYASLTAAEQIYAAAAEHSQRALATGDVTLEQSSADLALLEDVRVQLGAAQRGELQAVQALRTLLGVKPGMIIPLRPLAAPPMPDEAGVQAALSRLPQRRPDLLALRAGYAAQEERVRTAVLSQFPNISVGITRARDVSDVHTTGFGVTLTLPLFDRGRGDIAIQRATREQLRAEYQSRQNQARGDVWQLWHEMQQLQRQLRALDAQLPQLQRAAERARRAYEGGNFPAASYLTLTSAYLTASGNRFDLLQNLWTDCIGLATVLGTQIQPETQAPDSAVSPPPA